MEESVGGRGSIALVFLICEPSLGEDFIRCTLLIGFLEPLRLEVEHRSIPAVQRHQFIVRAEFDHSPMLEYADAIGMAHGGESVRDQNSGTTSRRGEQALEDFSLSPHIQLGRGFIEQYETCAHLY